MISFLPDAFALVLSPEVFLALVAGAVFGTIVGVLPGLGTVLGLVMVLPVTFAMPAPAAMALIVSVYCCSIYGGSISAILLNIPGTPASAASTLDGYPMAQRGDGDLALGWSTVGSFIGGMFSLVVLVLLAPQLARFSLKFGPIETFALILFAMTTIAWVSQGSQVKGLVASCMGIVLGLVGPDMITGQGRFDFGLYRLSGGFELISVLIGVFALSEVFHYALTRSAETTASMPRAGFRLAPLKEWMALKGTILRSAVIGTFVGILPGTGATAATFIAYADARRRSAEPERFGKGAPEGLLAPETANNAVSGGALVPTLSLGIPGDGATAVMLGALTIHGITPGVFLFRDQPVLVTAIFVLVGFANVAILFFGALGGRLWGVVLRTPPALIMSFVFLFSIIGAYASRSNPTDVVVAFGAGILGLLLRLGGFPLAPVIIGMILGPPLESSLRQGIVIADGSAIDFLSRPIAAAFLGLTVIILAAPAIRARLRRNSGADGPAGATSIDSGTTKGDLT